jgi:hypothetical protein
MRTAGMYCRDEALRRAREVEFDHFGRAGADEEQHLDVRAPFEQAGDHPIQLFMRIGHASQITLFHDRGGKARLGKDHHAGC